MKYIVRKENEINREYPTMLGIWYDVVPSNFILRWIFDNILIWEYTPFRDLKEAQECAELKSK